ncbi:diguanylate cyclase [Alteromonas pelagimontana]|uniref:diguanylate cyclase n=1 Tax=Alteromonas pelagimontana TaxID=1858656 RepID=A0A6M4MHV6_9ALTE|nr:diguanylate cyclase [Alteromonas pelagimontana]
MAATLDKLLKEGCSQHYDEETNRQILVVNLFSLVGISLTLSLGIVALVGKNYPLAFSLLTASFLFIVSRKIQSIFSNSVGRLLAMYLLTGCLMALMSFLVVTGGRANTGPLWIYIVPPVAMFFGGFRRGLGVMAGFTLLIVILLFFPDDYLLLTHYSYEFKTRLIYSFLTVTFLSAFYEYSRQKTYETAKELSRQFKQQALHDPLTHLPNRRGIQQQIEQELSRMTRHGRPISIVIVDVDHFKNINDTYGHDNGDVVLTKISEIFRKWIRRQDSVGRWGGEEFIFVLPETPETNGKLLADKVRSALEGTFINIQGNDIQVTASFGVCEINKEITLDRALRQADKALYQAKKEGRNCVVAANACDD